MTEYEALIVMASRADHQAHSARAKREAEENKDKGFQFPPQRTKG